MKINIYQIIIITLSSAMWSCDLDRIDPINGTCKDPEGKTFEFSYTGSPQDSALALLKKADSTYLITGNTQKQGSQVLLYQTNLCQENLLHLGLGDNSSEQVGQALCELGNGDVVVAGTQYTPFPGDHIYVARISQNNTITDVYHETYGDGIRCLDMKLLSDGSYLLGGNFNPAGVSGANAYFIKLDQGLDLSNTIEMPESFFSTFTEVLEVGSGHWAGIGYTWIGFAYRIYYVQTPNSGFTYSALTLTFNNITGDNSVLGRCGVVSSDGNIVIAGHYRLLSGSGSITFLKKIELDGDLIWEKDYKNSMMYVVGEHEPSAMIETEDGGFVIVGTHKLNTGNSDVFLLKVNSNGGYQWDQSYGGDMDDVGHDVIQETDQGYVLVGFTYSYNETGETGRTYLLKTDENGEIMN